MCSVSGIDLSHSQLLLNVNLLEFLGGCYFILKRGCFNIDTCSVVLQSPIVHTKSILKIRILSTACT